MRYQREGTLDNIAFDFGWPGPVEVGDGLEAFDPTHTQTPRQTATRAFGGFRLDDLFKDLMSRPAGLGGARDEVIQLHGNAHKPICWSWAERLSLIGVFGAGEFIRRSPGREDGYRAIGLAGDGHLRLGMRGNGSTKRPLRPQTQQRSRITGTNCGGGGFSTAAVTSDVPHSNDAGEAIESEP